MNKINQSTMWAIWTFTNIVIGAVEMEFGYHPYNLYLAGVFLITAIVAKLSEVS